MSVLSVSLLTLYLFSQSQKTRKKKLEAQGPCSGHISSINSLAEFFFTQETKGVTIAHPSTMSTLLANSKA